MRFNYFTLVFILLGMSISLQAQTYVLNIVVTDKNGEVIREPSIILKLEKQTINNQERKEGLITYNLSKTGKYTLDVGAEGFENLTKEIEIKSSITTEQITLEIKKVEVSLEVKEDNQQKSIDEMLGGFYTPEQIASLPNSPEEIRNELKRRYGDDVIILVDGFSNQIPDKSRIASIRVSQSSYDAEYHKIGSTYVLISTRVGEQSFGGSLGGEFNDESLNGRNPLSLIRLPQQNRYLDFNFHGPLIKNRATFYLWAINVTNPYKENIVAKVPEKSKISLPYTVSHQNSVVADANFNISKYHTGKLRYQFNQYKIKNLGIGQLNLPERASKSDTNIHTIQFSESGYFKQKFLNEFRFEWKNSSSRLTPNIEETSINVLGAFNSGGAGNKNLNLDKGVLLSDNLLFGVKKHAVKLGGLLEISHQRRLFANNQKGTFTFSDLNNYLAGRASLYTQTLGERTSQVTLTQLGLFLQDDFSIKKGVGISIGLRYEIQNNLSDSNNFSPRLGIVWSPLKNGKLTFRGGGGVFFSWLDVTTLSFIESQGLNQPPYIFITNPSFPNPFQSTNINQQQQNSYWTKAENLRNPEILHSSLAFNYTPFKGHKLRGEYVFQKGLHQLRTRDINAPFVGVRTNSNFANINQVESSSFFVRNTLSLSLNGIFSRGISYSTNYTLGKITSDSDSIFELPSNSRNLRLDRSFSNLDQRHRFSTSLNWRMNKQFGFGLIYNLASPLPFTITTGFDNNSDTVFNDRPLGVNRNSARGTWFNQMDAGATWMFSFKDKNGSRKGEQTSTSSANEIAPSAGLTDENKRFSLKLYISAKNIFNQTNLYNFVGVQTSPFFGKAIQARQSRRLDIGMRFNF